MSSRDRFRGDRHTSSATASSNAFIRFSSSNAGPILFSVSLATKDGRLRPFVNGTGGGGGGRWTASAACDIERDWSVHGRRTAERVIRRTMTEEFWRKEI